MNDEQKFYLGGALQALQNGAFDLENQIRKLETLDGSPTETNYDEILRITIMAITTAEQMTRVLKTISEDANLEPPESIVGAARKVNLGYSHTEKHETARIALESARGILNSHYSLVNNDIERVAEICHIIMNEQTETISDI